MSREALNVPAFSVGQLARALWSDSNFTGDVAVSVGALAQLGGRPTGDVVTAFLGELHPRRWQRSEAPELHTVALASGGVVGLLTLGGHDGLVLIALPFEVALIRGSRWGAAVVGAPPEFEIQ